MAKLQYPESRTCDHVDDYHGTLVPDPYRWLEDINSEETKHWIEAQNELTFSWLAKIPARDKIRERLTALWDFPKQSAPFKRGTRYFQFRNNGLQNQNLLYVSSELGQPGQVLLDPNTFSEDGTVALTGYEVSHDGQWLAYATSSSGSDWKTWHVRNIDSGLDRDDQVEWSKFSNAAWLPDSSGFMYSRYDAPEAGEEYAGAHFNQKVYIHHLGTPQSEDVLVYARPDQPRWGLYGDITADGAYVVMHISQGTDRRNRVYYARLTQALDALDFQPLLSDFDARYEFLGNTHSAFYFLTDRDAPRRKVVAVDLEHPEHAAWTTLIEQNEDALRHIEMVHDEFIAVYLHDAYYKLLRYTLNGELMGEIPLPALGSIVEINGKRDHNELFFSFESFTFPSTAYCFDFESASLIQLTRPETAFASDDYVIKQSFTTSIDGTRVPMFMVHAKDWQPDGHTPTLLFGYGGFNIPMTPTFDINRLIWLEMGGVLVVSNLRGGGEYGEEWHAAGTLHQKQNVFDDFIACAEHLIATGVTCTEKLVIEGRSNGGLLIGAATTQRPELFGATLPTVGVMDMLRFHKFTIGWAWVSDYGSADDPEQFKTLYAYSPVHNARPATYPPMLILTGDHDDRVMPAHSYKFAAAMQAAQQGDAPILIRIQTKAGHGPGKPTKVLIDERADIWAFVAQALGMDYT